ncbi:Asp-tRNA(Asn)/Glu-tRNA(Gln) amidotransferase subunit GatB [Candidatus Nesciobacter abundans]|uniref:Aspartyl/glutamyl-tRNA(Asn/Gln) amidotransferase subunit B n=1 Tax=Candidatus Nesciobacter abundans TaxID=2601668 RepID=A0A5C0UK07_9PROT|nr:Asp-tRNA(Asn)/Glu-tRNA(Gln) amidotransferase subunit GatB [Candidatus Nesciobacter abundans]QEK39184.1 Asp-tRNA(Asn)/Glu-tRNA(Gln) amidotransferase subunit GatB [Candidatus Nesciobacter abundans]
MILDNKENSTKTNQGWKMVIGLEVHAQINTKSKLFSRASTSCEKPNSGVDILELALPGALPVLNKECLYKGITSGLAFGMKINETSSFDRKHYFYPDLPSGYQITQFYRPIAQDGIVKIWDAEGNIKEIRLNRIHLETDAGKSIHKNGKTLIDLNRNGIPLMEIVTEPDISTAEEAACFFRILQATLKAIDTCDGNMEKGQIRADVNVSVHKSGDPLGTRVEVKNINSVRFMKKAINYEFDRQIALLEKGEKINQETRLFDENTFKTSHMRDKEDSSDYRYMPDPDLPCFTVQKEVINSLESSAKLPYDICDKISKLGVKHSDAWTVAENPVLTNLFLDIEENFSTKGKKILFNWLIGDVSAYIKENQNTEINPIYLKNIIEKLESNSISSKVAKEVFIESINKNKNPLEIIKENNLEQTDSIEEVMKVINQVLEENPKELESYKKGKTNLEKFFLGQAMKITKGRINPVLLQTELKKELSKLAT